ncbi:large ribosomal subunit protein uL18m [Narcine bancroftii]|uniref:large ribosomal subunit protein uL18m n=1 Tax=Narcine bancroftii TaxID=1343680 RepID=UPI003831B4E2
MAATVSTVRAARAGATASLTGFWGRATMRQVISEGWREMQGNEAVAPRFRNRNPRNLECLGLGIKDNGWQTTWPRRSYWHRLTVRKSQHYLTAVVESAAGEPVISASTGEWCIRRHLPSGQGVSAAQNLGCVLARRCLEAGLGYLSFRAVPWVYRSDTIQHFCKVMKESGMVLSEPRRVRVTKGREE